LPFFGFYSWQTKKQKVASAYDKKTKSGKRLRQKNKKWQAPMTKKQKVASAYDKKQKVASAYDWLMCSSPRQSKLAPLPGRNTGSEIFEHQNLEHQNKNLSWKNPG
jgi:hypothetical protein